MNVICEFIRQQIKSLDNVNALENTPVPTRWGAQEYGGEGRVFAYTTEELAGSEVKVLLHWFLAAIESQFWSRGHEYMWYIDSIESYGMGDVADVGVAADWACGTRESFLVAKGLFEQGNDVNVHLGDIYFTGTPEACRRDFCGTGHGVQFPWGREGLLAIPGNHEAFYHCIGFRNVVMPFCGTIQGSQKAPFWSIENKHWIVIGLDTGYNSIDLTAWSPTTNLEASNLNLKLPPEQIDWLNTLDVNKKGIVIFTHHHPITLYPDQPVFPAIADQLEAIFPNRTVLWFWGHQHVLILYQLQSWRKFAFHGRCIGNGGFPCGDMNTIVTNASKQPSMVKAVEHAPGPNPKYGRNGWCQFHFVHHTLTINYHLLQPNSTTHLCAKESFSTDANGNVNVDNFTLLDPNGFTTFNDNVNANANSGSNCGCIIN